MAGPLGLWLNDQQALRDETKAKVAQYTRWGYISAAVLAVLGLLFFRTFGATLGGALFGFAPFGMYAMHTKRKVTEKIKAEINGAIASALGLSYNAEVTQQRLFERVCDYKMVPDYDDSTLSDEWSGMIGEQTFTLHEAHLTEERGSGKSRKTVTVFRGVLISIGFPRRFHGTTLIERDNQSRGLFGGQKDAIKRGGEVLTRMDMVSTSFEDIFAVWTSDPVEAHYLVHPEYIERLVAVEEAWQGRNIRALFQGGELLVALEGDDMFESGSLESSEDRALLQQSADQFMSLTALVEELNERAR